MHYWKNNSLSNLPLLKQYLSNCGSPEEYGRKHSNLKVATARQLLPSYKCSQQNIDTVQIVFLNKCTIPSTSKLLCFETVYHPWPCRSLNPSKLVLKKWWIVSWSKMWLCEDETMDCGLYIDLRLMPTPPQAITLTCHSGTTYYRCHTGEIRTEGRFCAKTPTTLQAFTLTCEVPVRMIWFVSKIIERTLRLEMHQLYGKVSSHITSLHFLSCIGANV